MRIGDERDIDDQRAITDNRERRLPGLVSTVDALVAKTSREFEPYSLLLDVRTVLQALVAH